MRGLAAYEILTVWEEGLERLPFERAFSLLVAACPEEKPEELENLSVGQIFARLTQLRETMFGPHITAQAICDACGEQLDLTFETSDILRPSDVEPPNAFSAKIGRHDLTWRLPNGRDLLALEACPNIDKAAQTLLARCLLKASRRGKERQAQQLPEKIVDSVAGRMTEADPQADTLLSLTCPACQRQWPAVFNIAVFLWTELSALAKRLLREIHLLAGAYGWSEAEILAMSPQRRQNYLAMVSA